MFSSRVLRFVHFFSVNLQDVFNRTEIIEDFKKEAKEVLKKTLEEFKEKLIEILGIKEVLFTFNSVATLSLY